MVKTVALAQLVQVFALQVWAVMLVIQLTATAVAVCWLQGVELFKAPHVRNI